ncbi:colicin V production protein [mine drainage metagenome]|uniref:Colicin V production protein n=1 Tax=mine drainage metagenome TaxID=410659 RepID=A0A1J5QYB3_9ZZZZ
MNTFDYAVLAIVGLSILWSMMCGFVREVLSIAGWVAAFFVAKLYTLQLAPLLPEVIPTQSFRLLAAFVILFLATLLVGSLLAIALSEVFRKVGLGWLDRWLGAVFGLARGVIIVAVLVLLAGLTSIPQDARWRNAMFSAPLEALVMSMLPWFPAGLASQIKY